MNKIDKNNKQTKVRKIRVIPVLILIGLLVATIGAGLYTLKESVNQNLVRVKIKEGNLQAEKIFASMRSIDRRDPEMLESLSKSIASMDSSLVGIEVRYKGETIFVYREGFDEANTMQYTEKGLSFLPSDTKPYFATSGNYGLVKGMERHFDFSYAISYINGPDAEFTIADVGTFDDKVRDKQDIWYEFTEGDITIYSGHSVSINDSDLQLCSVTALALHINGTLIVVVMLIIIIRVFKSQDKIIKIYYTDKETGGYNWYYFLDHVDKLIKRSRFMQSKGNKNAMVVLRISKFNTFCSSYGEKEGDSLVKDVYEELKQYMSKKSLLARHDRSSFAMFIPYEEDVELKKKIAEILKQTHKIRPNASVRCYAGIYEVNHQESWDTFDAYMRASIAADKAENSFSEEPVFFNTSMRSDIQWETKMENDLDRGLANKEFEVYIQPKYLCKDEKIGGAEALVRWNHPTEGFLTPYKFIPVFEKNGLIIKLDDYMVSNVARIQAEFLAAGITPVPISVNISRIHFARLDLAEHICKLVDEYNVPHNLIEIELTESVFFDDQNLIIDITKKLREFGFEVSLDDFGAGYSSLNCLRIIPIDIVKIDGGFFRGTDATDKGQKIVKEIIRLAKQLELRVVAEGIEEREQVDFLTDSGCDLIQGYYFAKPMTLDQYKTELEKPVN